MTTRGHERTLYGKLVEELMAIFPDGSLRRPVFYSAKAGLRFEIGTGTPCGTCEGSQPETVYVRKALKRALALFDACFPAGPDFLLLDIFAPTETWKTELVDRYSRSSLLGNVKEIVSSPSLDEEGIRVQLLFDTTERLPDITDVLRNIILSDFVPDCSALGQSVFFFDCDRHLLFHLYDDRGLDIASASPQSIEPLHREYNSWILDYDRERTDNLFKHDYIGRNISNCRRNEEIKGDGQVP